MGLNTKFIGCIGLVGGSVVRDFPAAGWEELILAISSFHKAAERLLLGYTRAVVFPRTACSIPVNRNRPGPWQAWSLSWHWFGSLALSTELMVKKCFIVQLPDESTCVKAKVLSFKWYA